MEGSIDSTTMTALAVTLTVVAAGLSFLAYRRRGLAAGVKGLAWTLVPVAALLTGTLRLAVGIVDDVAGWAARLVLSPVVWSGLALAGVAVVLWVIGGVMSSRGIGVSGAAAERAVRRGDRARGRDGAPESAAGRTQAPPKRVPAAKKGQKQSQPLAQDEDMDEIEAILKKHGI